MSEARPRYDLVQLVATGGMGQVWRAEDTVLHRDVAVKLLKAEYAGDDLFRSRFEQEARLAAGLQHPHVASVLDYGEHEDPDGGPARPMLVMELVDGQPLSRLIGEESLTHDRAADLIAQAGEGLAAAHRKGIVHRDVKPGNLLVNHAGHVKVTDFGIARAADAASLTTTGHLVGTPHYLSPEQAEGEHATAASDVYALGVVLFECLTGTKPFESDSPVVTALRHVRDPLPPLPEDVPERLRAVVDRACAKDPAARFADGGEMAAALRGEVPIEAVRPAPKTPSLATTPAADEAPSTRVLPEGRPGPDTRQVPVARRGRGRWLLGALATLLVLGLFAWAITSLPGDDPGSSGPGGRDGGTSGTGGTGGTGGDATVQVDASDYVGRPEDEATAGLRELGVEPVAERRANPGGEEAGTVAAVRPTGEVERGSQVVLEVWEEPADPGNGNGNGNGNQGQGNGSEGDQGNQGNGGSDEGPLDDLPGPGEG